MLDVSVCIPVYNEKLALRKSITELIAIMEKLPYSYEVIVIDDGSSDNCIDQIRDLNVRIIRHRRNLGGGIARLTGVRYATGRIILQSDADCTYPCNKVPEILERMKKADMVIAARKIETAKDFKFLRIVMKSILKKLAGVLAGHYIPDLNSGMRAYDKELALNYAYLYPPGHSIMSTMTLVFIAENLKVEFIEIDYNVRVGKSSFHPIKDTYNYFLTIIRSVVFFDPWKFLMPIVVTLSVMASILTIRNLIVVRGFGSLPPLLWVADLILFVLAVLSDQFARLSKQMAFRADWSIYDQEIEEEKK
jgi:glycosyltransferase involved in cell wall biosynthesis